MSLRPMILIIEFIQGKIDNLKEKLASYDSPILQEQLKSSLYLQYDYLRLKTEILANEENLMIIKKFSPAKQTKYKNDDKSKPAAKNAKSKH